MRIILMEKTVNLGDMGDVVNVRDGYARNYLIPKGMARRASDANLAEFERRRADLEKSQADRLAAARARAEKLDGYLLQMSQKAGVDGKLFGSITPADIAGALQSQGFEVQKAEVRMPQGPLKQVGDYPIELHLHTDVNVGITVSVLGEH